MKTVKQKKLEKAGWKTGSADEFLGLTPEESAMVSIRLALAQNLKGRRLQLGISQVELARRLGSSQSRVAKMESAENSISVDLLVRGMLATGAKPKEVGSVLVDC